MIIDGYAVLLETNIRKAGKMLAMAELEISPIMFYTSCSDQRLLAKSTLLDFLQNNRCQSAEVTVIVRIAAVRVYADE